jgi:hypothetical protein
MRSRNDSGIPNQRGARQDDQRIRAIKEGNIKIARVVNLRD